MNSDLHKQMADTLIDDRLRAARRFRRARVESAVRPTPYGEVTVRMARAGDAGAITRLSELDGRRLPKGSTLVAEVGDVVLAARSLDGGASVADPFRPTAELTELLALRAAHLRNAANAPGHPSRRGPRAWLRALRARQRRIRLSE